MDQEWKFSDPIPCRRSEPEPCEDFRDKHPRDFGAAADELRYYDALKTRHENSIPVEVIYTPPRWKCDVHGEIENAVSTFKMTKGTPPDVEIVIEADYCFRCYIAALDKLVGRARRIE